MTIMDKIARRHNFRVLLHEKPFKGINGSGKHNNWSLGTDTGVNLLSPGKTASENLQFITFLVNVIAAVHKHNGLLKAAIMSATNSHRLGANEAPPAIISTFLGTQVSAVLDKLEASRSDSVIRFNAKNVFKMSGISHIPTLLRDNTDRNRTSAFAFTGNRFELRAVGSSDNCAEAMIVLNTIVADELTAFRERVDARIEAGVRKEKAIYEELKSMIRSSQAIRFDGNGYSEEWRAEAARRGLDCETCAPRVFDRYLDRASIEMFARMGVLSKVELEARTEVKWETYIKKIQIEGRVLGDLTMNHIVPIASRYEALLLDRTGPGRFGGYRPDQAYSAAYGSDPAVDPRYDRSPQGGQQDRGSAGEGARVPRYGGGLFRPDPQTRGSSGGDRGRPDVAAAQVPGAAVPAVVASACRFCGRKR